MTAQPALPPRRVPRTYLLPADLVEQVEREYLRRVKRWGRLANGRPKGPRPSREAIVAEWMRRGCG